MNNFKIPENHIPIEAFHVGQYISDELKARGIKPKDFAPLINLTPAFFNALLKGNENLTAEIAYKLEKFLKIKAEIWLRLQCQHEIDSLRIKYGETQNTIDA